MDIVRILDRVPRWLRDAILAVTRGRGPLGAVYDRVVHRFVSADIPQPPPSGSERVRLLIGPANEVGQGYRWARAVERSFAGVDAVAVMGSGGGSGGRADLRVPQAVYLRSRAWHDAFEEALARRTHVLIESARPLLGRRYGSDAFAEAARLRAAGVAVAMIFHGSDIRPPARHAADEPWSPYRDRQMPSALLGDQAERNLARLRRDGIPVFVTTPDLLAYVPEATWCPVVVSPADWQGGRSEPRAGRPLVVVHAPSSALIKGTHLIEPIVQRLAAEGLIEYRRVSGMPAAAMPGVYADADVFLDQFRIGGYGVAACEALASGRLVIGHVGADTRARVREQTGFELPIVEATVDRLEVVLRAIAADPDAFAALRRAGPEYVDAVHDGRRSAQALAGFLGLSA
jgi:hypothetical protein